MQNEYQHVPDAVDDDTKTDHDRDQNNLVPRFLQTRAGYCTICSIALLFWVLLIGGSLLVKSLTTSGYTAIASGTCSCGSSASEAEANGCTFDPFALIWVPDHCQDKDVSKMFAELETKQHHNWTFFEYPDKQRQLPLDEIATMAGDPSVNPGRVLTTLDWHNSHCLYTLLLLAKTASTDLSIPKRYAMEKHTQHCTKALLRLIATHPHSELPYGDSGVYVYP